MSETEERASTQEQEQQQEERRDGEKVATSGLQRWWQSNKGWMLVLVAECFGACMAATARLLEDDEKGAAMHPMQVMFFYSLWNNKRLTRHFSLLRSFSCAWA